MTRVICLLLVALLSACSIDISSTPTAPGTAQPQIIATAETTQLPVSWANLHLAGRLVYTAAVLLQNDGYIHVQSLDLATGTVTKLYQPPNKAWVDSAAISPDGKQMVISYAPAVGSPNAGQRSLYILPADGSQPPQVLVKPGDPKDQDYQVIWSPDGKYVYYTHVNHVTDKQQSVWRVAMPGGKPQKLLDNAYWPRLSEDGRRLTYVSMDLNSGANYLNVASADGSQPQQLTVDGLIDYPVIDVPMFTPDGQSILFSSQDLPQSSLLKGLGSLLTVELVRPPDGTIPSDWWQVPATGGKAAQLTRLAALSLYGSYSPDKQHIASSSTTGIFVMSPDGAGVTMIVPDVGGIPGTVQWVP